MTKIKYRFKGHESFILREGWLNKGMREVRNDPFVFSQNYGADVLGVGPNMAKAIRYWMRTCGLLDERGKQGVFLSKLGEQIWEYDKYLEETFSLWIIHCNIVKNRRQATAWNLFFNEYDEMEFTKDELVKELINKAENLDGLEKFSEKSVEADGEALLRMYVRKPERGSDPEEKNISPFGIFELVKQKGSLYWKSQPPLHLLPAEIVWYLLKDCTSKEGAVSIDDLLMGKASQGLEFEADRSGRKTRGVRTKELYTNEPDSRLGYGLSEPGCDRRKNC